MRKKTSMCILAILAFAMMLSMIPIAPAMDSKYYDRWDCIEYTDPITGDAWDWETSDYHFDGTERYYFMNDYPVYRNASAGTWQWKMRFQSEDLKITNGLFRIQAWIEDDPSDSRFGMEMAIRTNLNNYNVEVGLQTLDGEPFMGCGNFTMDIRNYHPVLVWRVQTTYSELGQSYWTKHSFQIEKWNAATEDVTILGNMTTGHKRVAEAMRYRGRRIKYHYGVNAIFQLGGRYKEFKMTCYQSDYDVGTNWDPAISDWSCDIYDIVFLASVYGEDQGDHPDWFSDGGLWTADLNGNGRIDMYEINYIIAQSYIH